VLLFSGRVEFKTECTFKFSTNNEINAFLILKEYDFVFTTPKFDSDKQSSPCIYKGL